MAKAVVLSTDLDPAHLTISATSKLQVAAGAGGKRRNPLVATVTPAPSLAYFAGHGSAASLTTNTTTLLHETATLAIYRSAFLWTSTTALGTVTQLRLIVPDSTKLCLVSCGIIDTATSQEPSGATMAVSGTPIMAFTNNAVTTYSGYIDFGYILP